MATQTSTQVESVPQVTSYTSTTPQGKWTLKSYSAFMAVAEGQQRPKYEDGDVIWDFGNTNDYGQVIVSKKYPEDKSDYSMAPGKYSFWVRNCIVKIGETMYVYSLTDDELKIDRNVDPSYGPDLPVLRFKKLK